MLGLQLKQFHRDNKTQTIVPPTDLLQHAVVIF